MIAARAFIIGKFLTPKKFHRFLQRKRKYTIHKISDFDKEVQHKIRLLKEDDINDVIQLRRKCTFHDRISSFKSCLQQDPEGFVVVTKNEKIIACGSFTNNNDVTTTGGFLTVHEDYRKSGLATEMIISQLPHVGNRNITSVTEVHNLKFHSKLFPFIEKDYVLLDYECPEGVNAEMLSNTQCSGIKILPFREEYLPSILEYDYSIVGYKRDKLVKLLSVDSLGKMFVAIKGSHCVGYGAIMLNIQGGGKLGPLYAQDSTIAEALLKSILKSFVFGKGFSVTTVTGNAFAVALFGNLGKMRKIINLRIYSRERFVRNLKDIYALFDSELEPF